MKGNVLFPFSYPQSDSTWVGVKSIAHMDWEMLTGICAHPWHGFLTQRFTHNI